MTDHFPLMVPGSKTTSPPRVPHEPRRFPMPLADAAEFVMRTLDKALLIWLGMQNEYVSFIEVPRQRMSWSSLRTHSPGPLL